MLRATLGQQQIVEAVFVVDMRPFRISAAESISQMMDVTQFLAGFQVYLASITLCRKQES